MSMTSSPATIPSIPAVQAAVWAPTRITRTGFFVEFAIHVATLEDAQAVAALFPKSYRVKATTLHTFDRETNENLVFGTVICNASLTPNVANAGQNEAGEARVAKAIEKAEALGYEFVR